MNATSLGLRASLAGAALSMLVHAQLQPSAELLASDAAPLDQFGRAVALSGERAIIGAPLDDDLGDASGSAYVFERAGGAWMEVAKLVPSNGAAGDRFGWAVAIDGDRALIGAPGPPGVGAFATYTKPGAVYVFERSGSQWLEVAVLPAPVPSAPFVTMHFGDGVSLSGERALVESDEAFVSFPIANARVHAFEKGPAGWGHAAMLSTGGAFPGYSAAVDGVSSSLQGARALVGDSRASPFGCHHYCGAAYVFEDVAGAWTLTATLGATPPYEGGFFGGSVALSGDAALIGSIGEFTAPGLLGIARVFELAGGTWSETAVLPSPPGAAGGTFGLSVALAGDRALVGAPSAAGGSTYLFEKRCGIWTGVAALAPAGAVLLDLGHVRFAALSDQAAIVGAAADDAAGTDAGAVHAYGLGPGAIDLSTSTVVPVKTSHSLPPVAKAIGELSAAALPGGLVEARLALSPPYAYLDGGWDFRWIHVVTSLATAGVPLAADPALGPLPAIAPGASDDPAPFYYDAIEWWTGQALGAAIHGEGAFSLFRADPSTSYGPADEVELATFLVAHDVAEGSLAATSFSVLGGFAWRYSGASGAAEVCKWLAPDPALVNAALAGGTSGCPGHAGCPGFPGWSATQGTALGPSALLEGVPASLTLATGGVQKLLVDAGPANASLIYAVLGSAAGTAPGLAFGAYTLPLQPDPYLAFTVAHPSTPPLANSLGVLDASGRATATFTVPAGSPAALAGATVNHACVVLDFLLVPRVVSGAAPLALAP